MRRLARRLFTLCSAGSLLLCVAACVLWAVGRRHEGGIRHRHQWVHDTTAGGEIAELRHAGVAWDASGLRFVRLNLQVNSSLGGLPPANHIGTFKYDFTAGRVYGSGQDVIRTPYAEYSEIGHFKVPPSLHGGSILAHARGGTWEIAVPHWLAAAGCAVVPLAWLVACLRGRWPRQAGLCPACGYDLRASPGRCPECGAVARAPGGHA